MVNIDSQLVVAVPVKAGDSPGSEPAVQLPRALPVVAVTLRVIS